VKYEVTLTLELEIDAPTREAAERVLDGLRTVVHAEPGIAVWSDLAEWEDDDGN
jgi:hypothetical protein